MKLIHKISGAIYQFLFPVEIQDKGDNKAEIFIKPRFGKLTFILWQLWCSLFFGSK